MQTGTAAPTTQANSSKNSLVVGPPQVDTKAEVSKHTTNDDYDESEEEEEGYDDDDEISIEETFEQLSDVRTYLELVFRQMHTTPTVPLTDAVPQ